MKKYPLKKLSIIIPSYNDVRIAEAIESVRRFDNIDVVKLIVIDGGSCSEVLNIISTAVLSGDIFVSETDNGIFDALNKGLDRVDTEYVGWLGSDDLYTGQVKSSDVVDILSKKDIFVSGLAMFKGEMVRRIFDARIMLLGLMKFGLHNPHYSTFGRSSVFKAQRFTLTHKGSDIEYFLNVFEARPSIATTGRIGVAMREGGFSNQSKRRIIDINRALYPVYRDRVGSVGAATALLLKLGWKIVGRVTAQLRGQRVANIMVQ